ncbi:MAG: alpha/beta hydrolase [Bacteroidetes bacterium]|nr:MAG: alpha/beta hydrolase [Bacteroidota bacterium]
MEGFNYPYAVKKVKVSDPIQIAYVDEGYGDRTLLMIHGLGSYIPAWQKNIEGLKSQFRCIALDLPNYGKSTKGFFPFTMSFFAEVLAAFIKKLELKNVTLVGHSMGAQIAVTTFLETDTPIQNLVLLAPAGFETFSAKDRNFFYKNVTAKFIKAMSVKQIKSNFDLNFHNNSLPQDADFMFRDRLSMRADKVEYNFYAQMVPKCVRAMLEAPVFDQLNQVDIPTLIIYGREDLLIPNKALHPESTIDQIAQAGHQQIPGSQLELISPCGHFVQWECPEKVNQLIADFFAPI